ncbi:hypothetical protein V6N13_105213 [Hibiscus sabdariffa]|uniref:Secreted protein n=1 Tax=Hibiscus sabdariffa TaxID=183260 RepID=A0ABR1ZS68_9ROSI
MFGLGLGLLIWLKFKLGLGLAGRSGSRNWAWSDCLPKNQAAKTLGSHMGSPSRPDSATQLRFYTLKLLWLQKPSLTAAPKVVLMQAMAITAPKVASMQATTITAPTVIVAPTVATCHDTNERGRKW